MLEGNLNLHNPDTNNISQVAYGNVIFACKNSTIYILGISSQFKEGKEKKLEKKGKTKFGIPKGKQEVNNSYIGNPDIIANNEVFEESSINLKVLQILKTTEFKTYTEEKKDGDRLIFKSTHLKGKTLLLSRKKINNLMGTGMVYKDKHSGKFRRVRLFELGDISNIFKVNQLLVINQIIKEFGDSGFEALKLSAAYKNKKTEERLERKKSKNKKD